MRAAFLAFLAYAIIAFAAPISVPVSSTEASTDSAALSSTSVSVATASLTSTAAVPAPSSSSVSPTPSSGAQHDDDDDGDDTQDEDEDDPDDDEDEDENDDEPDEDENEPDENDEDEDKQDEDDDDDGDDSDSDGDCEDDDSVDSDSKRSHEKFRVEFEIDAKTARPFLSSILQPADAHLDVKLDLDASKVGGLLTVLIGDLNRVLDDAANLVEIGGDIGNSGGRGGFVNGSPQSQNGTLTTQTSRSASPSADFSSDSEGKITLRARTRLHGNHNDN